MLSNKLTYKKYVYSKRDYTYIPTGLILIFAIFTFFYILNNLLSNPEFLKPEARDSKNIYIAVSIVCIGFGFFWLWFRLLKREIQLNKWGVQYKVGKKIKIKFPWNIIGCIQNQYVGGDHIIIYKKGSKFPHNIYWMHPKERIEAFKKMAEYAKKYNIEIDDQLGYLNKE
jgi:hypothetical protein